MDRPYGARFALLFCGLCGEVLFAGAIFGWNALALILKQEGLYDEGCDSLDSDDKCSSQDTKLAIIWTAGVFAVNFGSVFGGPSLDYLGPRVTSTAGALQSCVGLLLLSFGFSSPKALFPVGAFLLALGGLIFHMSQFHIAQLFPSNKGLVSSLFVGGFIGSGFTFEILRQVYNALQTEDSTQHITYRNILLAHACLCTIFVPCSIWMAPRAILKAGDQYQFKGCCFIVTSTPTSEKLECSGSVQLQTESRDSNSAPGYDDLQSSDQAVPVSTDDEDACARVSDIQKQQQESGKSGHDRIPRWAVLAKRPFPQQLKSPEFFALGLFFSWNVLVLQFYLGTARIQLEEMSTDYKHYVQILSFIVPGIFVLAPFNGYILDRLGYGIVLIVINTLVLLAVLLQMIPVIQLQVVMFISWAAARYLLYSSFFTIVGSIFSYQSFGRIIGVISVTAGLLGLLQLPFTSLAINTLDRSFLPLQIAAAVLVVLLYCPAFLMYKWERQ